LSAAPARIFSAAAAAAPVHREMDNLRRELKEERERDEKRSEEKAEELKTVLEGKITAQFTEREMKQQAYDEAAEARQNVVMAAIASLANNHNRQN
jgi:hypothetical protein